MDGTRRDDMHAEHDQVTCMQGMTWSGVWAWNEEALDSAASYCRVPMSSSLDLASHTRQDGIQYRVGLHQVCLSPVRCLSQTGVSEGRKGIFCSALATPKG